MAWRFVRANTRVKTRTASPSRAQTDCDWENLGYVEGVEGGIGPPARTGSCPAAPAGCAAPPIPALAAGPERRCWISESTTMVDEIRAADIRRPIMRRARYS